MFMNILTILSLIYPIFISKEIKMEFSAGDVNYTYLHFHQNSFHIYLSHPVFLDKKSFNNLWVYKNGLVTLDVPLDKKDNTTITEGKESQSLDKVSGSNIIAVFGTENEMGPKSVVRARELSIELLDNDMKKITKIVQNKIKKAYKKHKISPFEYIVEIEWINMRPVGTEKEVENSFKLYLLNSKYQSFSLIQYTNIQSYTYKIGDKALIYESGLITSSNKKYILPSYNMTNEKLSAQRSSKTGDENSWLLCLGDVYGIIEMGIIIQKPENIYPRTQVPQSQQRFNKTINSDLYNKNAQSHKIEKSKPSLSNQFVHQIIYSHIATSTINKWISNTKKPPVTRSKNLKKSNAGFEDYRFNEKQNDAEILQDKVNNDDDNNNNDNNRNNIKKNSLNVDNQRNSNSCSKESCGENEECFISKSKTCCKCVAGTSYKDGRCLQNDKSFSFYSKGSVNISSMNKDGNIDLTLMFSKKISENFPRAHLTLVSQNKISLEMRNFLLLLYPIFHVPIAFYAFSWENQSVPNLGSLIGSEMKMFIFLMIGDLEAIHIKMQLERQFTKEYWIVSLDNFDIHKITKLNLHNRKFDEKTFESYNLMYIVKNDSVEFPEQSKIFQDENNIFLKIIWKGVMVFPATCLSKHVGNKIFYVKFSENRYCSSDCHFAEVNKNYCRMVCLGSPHVFDKIPDPCEGNFCEDDKKCVNIGKSYGCHCLEDSYEKDGKCISSSPKKSHTIQKSENDVDSKCSLCSKTADCQIIANQTCCICKNDHMGTGKFCVHRDSEFELKGKGIMNISKNASDIPQQFQINLTYAQWKNDTVLNHKAIIDFGIIPYFSVEEKQLLLFLLQLSPLYDVPLALFARNPNNLHMKNILDLSGGNLKIKLEIDSNLLPPLKVQMNIYQRSLSFDINMKVTGITSDFVKYLTFDKVRYFSQRNISIITYRIKRNQIKFSKHKIIVRNKLSNHKMWWRGTGKLQGCGAHYSNRYYQVILNTQYNCDARCDSKICRPYCQNVPILRKKLKKSVSELICSEKCHEKAQCLNGICICRPGFAGNGLICHQIRKILECRKLTDCRYHRFTMCKEKKCVCKPGFILVHNKCTTNETCQFCNFNEQCVQGKCLCKPKFLRNRVSLKCRFDCSLCDEYSTSCDEKGCFCKHGFVRNNLSNETCDLRCLSDFDCPTNEKCNSNKVCVCPTIRTNDQCYPDSVCNKCHKNATCHENICICSQNWIGNGLNCFYNCSQCFDKRFCTYQKGCHCPPNYEGNGIECKLIPCDLKCPKNFKCLRNKNEYQCVCQEGYVLHNNDCIEDIVHLNILPSGDTIEVTEGSNVDLYCLARSQSISFSITWSRKSSNKLAGYQEFVDPTNKTLQLRLPSINRNEADLYFCKTNRGEQTSIKISIKNLQCREPCGKFAICEKGVCKCQNNFVGDGIKCEFKRNCSLSCSKNEICNLSTGKCTCRSGFVNNNNKCTEDCRRHSTCDSNAHCNNQTGLCECKEQFIGNGTKCWNKDNSCIVNKICASHATCSYIPSINYYLCVCDQEYIGDGLDFCFPKVDCNTHQCKPNSFCESKIIRDHLGNQFQNGICTCKVGYILENNECREYYSGKTLWMSMGESLISHRLGESTSKIRYIDLQKNNDVSGVITALTGNCLKKVLIWSGQNGGNIKSSYISNISKTTTHFSNFGKITGLSADQETGNVFFSDSYRGQIGVINIEKNFSRILIDLEDYSPGPIVVHPQSGQLFWIVNDYQNPRIEKASLNGEDRKVFVSLTNQPINLLATDADSRNKICWTEIKENFRKWKTESSFPIKAFLKCKYIDSKYFTAVETVHRMIHDEPFSAFAYFNQQFYWSIWKGKYIKSWGSQYFNIRIRPNCCDVSIRSLLVMPDECHINDYQNNPCSQKEGNRKCPEICVQKVNSKNQMSGLCLSSNV